MRNRKTFRNNATFFRYFANQCRPEAYARKFCVGDKKKFRRVDFTRQNVQLNVHYLTVYLFAATRYTYIRVRI